MRTTLDIEEPILEAARAIASQSQKSIGAVISELARQGLDTARPPVFEKDFPTFPASPGAKPLDIRAIRRLIENDGLD